MGGRQFVVNSTQLIAILLDVIGLVLNLVGASIARAHPKLVAGFGLYWVGFALLILALIVFILSLRSSPVPSMRPSPSPPPP